MPSAIGEVVPALVGVFTTALAAEPTKVYGGPKPTSANAREYVLVAFNPEPDGNGVETEQDISDLGNRWVDEQGTVQCSVTCWSGSTDPAPLLARCDTLLDLLDAALVADPTLGGVIYAGYFARILGAASLRQESTADGAIVRLGFTVTYSTLLG